MSPIKLLLITNRYPAHRDDTASPFVADFVDGLRHNDVDCTILTPYHDADYYDDDFSITRFPWGETKRTIGSLSLFLPSSWKKIVAYFREGYKMAAQLHQEKRFDFCLALWAAPSGMTALRLKRRFGLPYAVWCLGSDIHTYARLPYIGGRIIETLRQSDRMFSDGHALGEMAQEMSGCRYFFLPSLRKVTLIKPEKELRQERLFVCPGRIEKSKGVFDLLEAFHFISKQHNSWSLYYIGDGSAFKVLQKEVKRRRLNDRVHLLGFLPTAEMCRMVSLAAAVVIPTHADSLPLTFGEAIQLRRPVIATDVGDLRYFIEKFNVGMVAPPNSPEDLAKVLSQFISEKTDYSEGFDDCAAELDIDAAAAQFADWLKNHLSHKNIMREAAVC